VGPAKLGRAEAVALPRGPGGGLSVPAVVSALASRGLKRIFVEGGGITVSRFLAAGALDRLHVTVAPLLLGSGIPSFTLPGVPKPEDGLRLSWEVYRLGADLLFDIPLVRR
jgi:riboflavin biosynthesis pyrimidine reductase